MRGLNQASARYLILMVAAMLSGFQIDGLGSALLGALIVSVTGWIGSGFVGPDGRYEILVVEKRRLRG